MAAGLFRIDEPFLREDLARVKADGDKLRIGRTVNERCAPRPPVPQFSCALPRPSRSLRGHDCPA